MKRLIASVILLSTSYVIHAQQTDSQSHLDSGKAIYKREVEKQASDFSLAYKYLQAAVQIKPDHAEARYFLGYTIDKMNMASGEEMNTGTLERAVSASEQFERIIRLEPKYMGEIAVQDPYSKISSIWGSLALAYLNQNKQDSAKWAFDEGKKRGGFLEPVLAYNRELLNGCVQGAILIAVGDITTFPIYYLQHVESFRKDITLVDASLVHSSWYPKFLKRYNGLSMSYTDAQLDTLTYQEWEPKEIEIKGKDDTSKVLRWILRPTYLEQYILKGDRVLLDILQQNSLERTVYFPASTDTTFNLFLQPFFVPDGLVSQLVMGGNTKAGSINERVPAIDVSAMYRQQINNSQDATMLLNNLRIWYYTRITEMIKAGRMDESKALFKRMDENLPSAHLPFATKELEDYYNYLRGKIEHEQP